MHKLKRGRKKKKRCTYELIPISQASLFPAHQKDLAKLLYLAASLHSDPKQFPLWAGEKEGASHAVEAALIG